MWLIRTYDTAAPHSDFSPTKNWTIGELWLSYHIPRTWVKVVCIIIQESKDVYFCSKPKHVGHHQSGYKFHWYDSCRDSCSALISLRIFAEESLQVFLWHPKVWEQLNGTTKTLCFTIFIDHLSHSLSLSLSLSITRCLYVYVIAFFAGWTNMFLLSWFVCLERYLKPPNRLVYINISPCWLPMNFAILRYPVPSDHSTSRSFYSYGAIFIIYRWSIQRKKNTMTFHSYII